MRTRTKIIGGVAAALVIGGFAAAAGAGSSSTTGGNITAGSSPSPAGSTAPASTAPAYQPAHIKGTGTCNYTIGNDPVDGSARATAEMDARNTGTVPATVKLTVTWPQEGYGPLRMSKTVRFGPGQSRAVPFHRPLSYDELSQLQDWQSSHGERDGCHYDARITS